MSPLRSSPATRSTSAVTSCCLSRSELLSSLQQESHWGLLGAAHTDNVVIGSFPSPSLHQVLLSPSVPVVPAVAVEVLPVAAAVSVLAVVLPVVGVDSVPPVVVAAVAALVVVVVASLAVVVAAVLAAASVGVVEVHY